MNSKIEELKLRLNDLKREEKELRDEIISEKLKLIRNSEYVRINQSKSAIYYLKVEKILVDDSSIIFKDGYQVAYVNDNSISFPVKNDNRSNWYTLNYAISHIDPISLEEIKNEIREYYSRLTKHE